MDFKEYKKLDLQLERAMHHKDSGFWNSIWCIILGIIVCFGIEKGSQI